MLEGTANTFLGYLIFALFLFSVQNLSNSYFLFPDLITAMKTLRKYTVWGVIFPALCRGFCQVHRECKSFVSLFWELGFDCLRWLCEDGDTVRRTEVPLAEASLLKVAEGCCYASPSAQGSVHSGPRWCWCSGNSANFPDCLTGLFRDISRVQQYGLNTRGKTSLWWV